MLEGLKIIIADDNKLNQRIAGFVLEKNKAIIQTANNGKEAIEYLQNQPFDAILMDLQMPEMDGYEATAYIRNKMKNGIPIIGLTANTLFGEEEKCLEVGMNACISKPFDHEELCALIIKVLKK